MNKNGYFLVEVLIALVMFVMIALAMFSSISFILVKTERSRYDLEAGLIMQEGSEIAYNVIQTDWSTVPPGNYWPTYSVSGPSTNWNLTKMSGPQEGINAMFTRDLEILRVCRKSFSLDYRPIGATEGCSDGLIDDNSRVIRTKVSWDDRGEKKEISSELLVVKI